MAETALAHLAFKCPWRWEDFPAELNDGTPWAHPGGAVTLFQYIDHGHIHWCLPALEAQGFSDDAEVAIQQVRHALTSVWGQR